MRDAEPRALQSADPAEVAQAHQRLQQLYQISKLLTRFESVERTVPEVLTLVSDAVPLSVASLTLEEQGAPLRTRVITWHAEGLSFTQVHAAKLRGRTAYADFVRRATPTIFDEEVGAGMPLRAHTYPTSESTEANDSFLFLPLVVGRGAIFGALQVQGASTLDEADLTFVNAVVNQLAVSLDRAAVVRGRQAEAEVGRRTAETAAALAKRDEQTQRFLSETSELLYFSLDLRTTLTAVARAAVPLLGDVCVIDEVVEGGRLQFGEVVIANPEKLHLADRFRDFVPAPDWDTPSAKALRWRKTVVVTEVSSVTTIAHDVAHAELLSEVGVQSTMSVPLNARGQTLGVLTLMACDSGHRYSARDVALAEDLGRRAAVAMDNARLYAQAQREIRARQDLLAVVSHEMRNPLGAIGNALSILNLAPRDLRVSEQARATMERQLAQMVRFVDDLLDVSRITEGKLELRHERVELASVLHQAVETCAAAMKSKHHDFVLNLPDAPMYVHGDPIRLVQVFSNLLTNACKYTEKGGHIRLRADARDDEAVVSIEDDGIGNPPAKLARIFDMFMQVESSLEHARGGLGIGLTLVQRLVEMHGGSVAALSEGGGRGSKFVVRLPICGPPDPPTPATSDGDMASGLRILVVDDNVDGAESLARVLRMSKNTTYVAYDGLVAFAMAAEFRPDVILLDIGLPKLNGHEAARRIRAQPWGQGMFIVALTGWGQEEDRRKSKEAGFDHHLVKPVDTGVLMKLLAAVPRRAT